MLILGLVAAIAAITFVSLFAAEKVASLYGSNWGFSVILVGLVASAAMIYGQDLTDFMCRLVLAIGVSLGASAFCGNAGVNKFRVFHSI